MFHFLLGWGFLFGSGLVDFFFWPFFLCSDITGRLEFSSWIWWCNSGGRVPWEVFHGGFLDGVGLRGATGHFLSYYVPFRHLLVSFLVKFFHYCSRPFLLCYVWDGNMHLCLSQGCIFFPVWCSIRGYFPELRCKISCLWLTEHSV